MRIPVILTGQCLVDTVVEVFVVGEDNMAPNVVELMLRSVRCFAKDEQEGQIGKENIRSPQVSHQSRQGHQAPHSSQ